MGSLKTNWNLKYSEIHPSQSWSIKNFEGGSVSCLKSLRDKSSRRGSHSNEKANLTSMGKRGLQNAGLSNSASHISRRSEQLHVSRLTLLHSNWDADIECLHNSEVRVQHETCISIVTDLLLGQLTPHIMWELIHIMEGLLGIIIPLWPL